MGGTGAWGGLRVGALIHSSPLCDLSCLPSLSQPNLLNGDDTSAVNLLGGLEISVKYLHGVFNK